MVAIGLSRDLMPVVAAGAGLLVAVFAARKTGLIPSVPEIAYGVGSAAVDTVDAVVAGAVTGVGKVVGVPETNRSQCQRDLARGDMWEASFSCPAKDFLQGAWNQYRF